MEIPIELKCTSFDSQILTTGTTRLDFFGNAPVPSAESAALMREAALVRWLLGNTTARDLLFDRLRLPTDSRWATEVRAPFLDGRRGMLGDIDVLACIPAHPEQAVAMEWKRVKVQVTGYGQDKANRIDAIRDAESQVRDLHALGFSKTMLGIVAVADGQRAEDTNFMFRGASNQTYRRTLETATGLALPEKVGLIYVEVCQPISKPISEAAMICAALARAPRARSQPERLTTLVANYLSASDKSRA